MPLYEYDGKRPTLPDDGSAWIAPSADIVGDVRLGRNVSIWFGAVIRADNTPIIIGDESNIQEGAVLHSDPGKPLTIGSGCTIGHQAMLHGCTIGDRVLVGIKAVVLNEAVIADGCMIGAGALVTERKQFPPRSLILGAPASVARELSEEQARTVAMGGGYYVERAQRFASGLTRID